MCTKKCHYFSQRLAIQKWTLPMKPRWWWWMVRSRSIGNNRPQWTIKAWSIILSSSSYKLESRWAMERNSPQLLVFPPNTQISRILLRFPGYLLPILYETTLINIGVPFSCTSDFLACCSCSLVFIQCFFGDDHTRHGKNTRIFLLSNQ